MLDGNVNKIIWSAIAIGIIEILGLGTMKLLPNIYDSTTSTVSAVVFNIHSNKKKSENLFTASNILKNFSTVGQDLDKPNLIKNNDFSYTIGGNNPNHLQYYYGVLKLPLDSSDRGKKYTVSFDIETAYDLDIYLHAWNCKDNDMNTKELINQKVTEYAGDKTKTYKYSETFTVPSNTTFMDINIDDNITNNNHGISTTISNLKLTSED